MSTKSKNIKQKVVKIVESDIFRSIAVASVLLNILFIVSIFILTSTDTFDRKFYSSAHRKYCSNIAEISKRAKELGSEPAAVKEWQVTCISEEFEPFYKEALEKFNAQYSN